MALSTDHFRFPRPLPRSVASDPFIPYTGPPTTKLRERGSQRKQQRQSDLLSAHDQESYTDIDDVLGPGIAAENDTGLKQGNSSTLPRQTIVGGPGEIDGTLC